MKKLVVLSVIIVFIIATLFYMFFFTDLLYHRGCFQDAKYCPDGSFVGREGLNCKFEKCPDLILCETDKNCPDGMQCFKFPDNEKPYCYNDGNRIKNNCDDSGKCNSYVCPPTCKKPYESCQLIDSEPPEIICVVNPNLARYPNQ